ncbi:hypothetical protein JZ751_020191 [Albula glossodonta]|uniref:Ceramide kinase C-terminal domain-containing protein n=1 Tax=Albula glossodonta TaxID=121402 RepID=A0A8T2NMY2_9TELE|nr:hypothetical protein JZ751_020191 [Albula glossodonta]
MTNHKVKRFFSFAAKLWSDPHLLDNGSMALISVGNTSRSEFIKHLKRYSSVKNQVRFVASCTVPWLLRGNKFDSFSFSFVETHSVQAVKVRPLSRGSWPDDASEENMEFDSKHTPIISSEGNFPWNIDGDLLELPSELLVRVHPQLVMLFGANVEETEEAPVKCSCI